MQHLLGDDSSGDELPHVFTKEPQTHQPSTSLGLFDQEGWYEPLGPRSDVLPALDGLPVDATLNQMIRKHSEKVLTPTPQVVLNVSRDTLWPTAFAFYKSTLHDPDKLKKRLSVVFEHEPGVDAGSVGAEFFELLLREVNLKLFEGGDRRRLPKRDWGSELEYEIAGTIVSHSVLHAGPGFPCLSPSAYAFIIAADIDLESPPVKDDIPLNLATKDLHDFIEQVSKLCFVHSYRVVGIVVPPRDIPGLATVVVSVPSTSLVPRHSSFSSFIRRP